MDNLDNNDSTVVSNKKGLFISLGIIYRTRKEYDKALDVYDKALQISDDKEYNLVVLMNQANIFNDQGKFSVAEELLQKIYNERMKLNEPKKTALVLDHLGSVKAKLGKIEGLKNMLEALEIRKREKDSQRFYISYKHLTEYYKNRNNLDSARYYANLGYEMAAKYGDSYVQDALSNLLKLSGDSLVIEYINTNLSLESERLNNENKFASAKYNLAKEQRKTLENQLIAEKQRGLKRAYQIAGGAIVILGIFLIIMIISRQRKKRLEEIYFTETRISKKVHDEVANDVYHVMAKLQHHKKVSDEVMDDLEQIYSKTRDISKENTEIDVKENYADLLTELFQSFQSEAVSIVTRDIYKVSWRISDQKKTALYRVLQELLVNMRKHSKASLVAITFKEDKGKRIIEYKDNGVGCELKKLGGLHNAENRIENIKGTINFDSEINYGFKAIITL